MRSPSRRDRRRGPAHRGSRLPLRVSFPRGQRRRAPHRHRPSPRPHEREQGLPTVLAERHRRGQANLGIGVGERPKQRRTGRRVVRKPACERKQHGEPHARIALAAQVQGDAAGMSAGSTSRRARSRGCEECLDERLGSAVRHVELENAVLDRSSLDPRLGFRPRAREHALTQEAHHSMAGLRIEDGPTRRFRSLHVDAGIELRGADDDLLDAEDPFPELRPKSLRAQEQIAPAERGDCDARARTPSVRWLYVSRRISSGPDCPTSDAPKNPSLSRTFCSSAAAAAMRQALTQPRRRLMPAPLRKAMTAP